MARCGHRAKEAFRSSRGAGEAFRKYLEVTVGGKVDGLIKTDKDYLSAMGVAEKSLWKECQVG